MRLKINQLETHLKNSTNKPIYVVSGDEPFQKQECIDQIRNHYKKQGFNERVVLNVSKGFDWNLINEANNNLSLFSNQKIIELRMKSPKPGREGGNILQEYAARQNDDTLLIISSDKMDAATKKTKWGRLNEPFYIFFIGRLKTFVFVNGCIKLGKKRFN